MKAKTSLKIVLWISILGLLFSGYLSYGEVIAKKCFATALGLGSCTNVAGIPACVFGFAMYLVILIISIIGLRSSE